MARAQKSKQSFSLGHKEHLYQVIFELNKESSFSIKKLCERLEVSRSGYYKWINKDVSPKEKRTEIIAKEIQRIFDESKETFGVVRIHYALKRECNLNISFKCIRRIMRILGIRAQIRRKRPNWMKIKPYFTTKNIISRNFETNESNKKWFTDISYLNYGNGKKAYISAIIDRYDLSIVAYKISKYNDLKIVMDTLEIALNNHQVFNTVLHSDRGFQYTSKSYKEYLDAHNVKISMSKAGSCLDNQPIEAFWGTLKSEYYYRNKFTTYEELESGISSYIDYYMNKRYVPKFDGLTPSEYRKVS
ncbi:IS3 family transposase [Staphylococcus nepalensis]|uniref:IS3 family transposase n=1 Tax=Staphylococcus nepalensis TaxID=214473 RepID=UPI001E50D321|nr:IS3 family transposase [Staphylococcus nepalensis]